MRGRRRRATLAAGIAGPDDAPGDEAAAVGRTLAASLAGGGAGRARLHEQPWYAIIGPPGAGKTTALLNAGLSFAPGTAGPVGGVGGTRLCDWWFAEQAVLIDTAGRYTTQDSSQAVDAAGWQAFLDLLRRTRPAQPLNGVIVAISLAEIADAPPEQRDAHARAIRARLDELQRHLGLRLPIYVWFTKTDLIAGFAEYVADLDRAARDQVWGATLPAGITDPAAFGPELQLLVDRLHQGLPDRLQAEPNLDRRALIAGFPLQFATLQEPLTRFLAACFAPGGSAPMLRGVYFNSATQEGTPIDRLLGTMARSFGLSQRRADAAAGATGRSYFLHDLPARRDPERGDAGRQPPGRAAPGPAAAGRRVRRDGAPPPWPAACWCWWRQSGAGRRCADCRRLWIAIRRRPRIFRSAPWPIPTCPDWCRCWMQPAA